MSDHERQYEDAAAGQPESDPVSGMRFPQVARLELDELLEQLVTHAGDVQRTQGRLRGLLRAFLAVSRADDLEELLRHVLDAAATLVDASYAALGVVQEGRLVRFLHVGMDEATVTAIGRLPEGKGLLGRLIEHPAPLRLRTIADDVSSVGFPEGHPPMRCFLGVPIRVGDSVFGNLYLTDKRNAAEFTADDQELVEALAAAAGIAVENAALVVQARRGQRWQAAMVQLTTEMLAGQDPQQAFEDIVERARSTCEADGAALCVPDTDPALLRIAIGRGILAPHQGQTVPRAGSAVSLALDCGTAIHIGDLASDLRTAESAQRNPGLMQAVIAAPIRDIDETVGVLLVARSPGNGTFDKVDVEMIDTYANQAGLANQLAGMRRDKEQLQLADERYHIADDLGHTVIQRLFALGLSLQALAPRIGNRDVSTRVSDKVTEIDSIIDDIRSVALDLRRKRG